MSKTSDLFARRERRVRSKIRRRVGARPRLSVFRSGRHIYAQVIDDARGVTLAAASTVDKGLKEKLKTGADKDAAKQVGLLIAERAKAQGIGQAVFDRAGYQYHGRVKALAEAARTGGLGF